MEMTKEKKFVKKSSAESGIVLLMAALNVLTLAFTVVRGGIEYLSESEFYFSNGLTLAFSGYPVIVDKIGIWLRIYSAGHFTIAIMLILALGIFAMVKHSFKFGRLGVASVIISAALSIFYMVHGIIAYSIASDYAVGYYECSTAAYVPFIFSATLTVAFFLVKYKAPEKIELP